MIINAFSGLRNTVHPRDIPENGLFEAFDVDLTDAGGLRVRRGSVLALSAAVQSAYSTQQEEVFFVANGELRQFMPDLSQRFLANSTATDYAEYSGTVFTNDGLRIENAAAIDLKIPTPRISPSLSESTGSLREGWLQVCYAYRRPDGLMGGTSPIAALRVKQGGVKIEPLPAIAGYETVLLTTDIDGSVFHDPHGAAVSPAHLLAEGFEPCEKVAFHDNRLFCSVFDGGYSIIRFSHTYLYHLYDHAANTLILPGKVNAMMSAGAALIIGTDKEILAYDQGAVTVLANYGVPEGKSMAKAPDGTVFIHSKRGWCSALPFVNITENKAIYPHGTTCYSAYVRHNGIRQAIALTST